MKYTIQLKFSNEIVKIASDSISEGIEKLQPKFIKGKGVLTVMQGKKKAEVFLYPHVARRLSVNKISRLLMEKRMQLALK